MSGLFSRLFHFRQKGKLEITSDRRRDKNVRASVAIMSMADSRPRPTPKPRLRPKSVGGATVLSTNSSPNLSTSLGNNPPTTRPKPAAYKTLEFNSKFLVNITADIDIENDSTNSDQNITQRNETFEKNNNVANIKHNDGKSKNCMGNGLNNYKAKDVGSSGSKCSKPLPPLPKESPVLIQEGDSSSIEDDTTTYAENPSTLDASKLPKKPPRLHSSSSDSQICTNKDTTDRGAVFAKSSDFINRKRNPPLPRKPTCLRKSTGPEESFSPTSSTFYVDSLGMGERQDGLVRNQNTTSLDTERTSREEVKMHTYSSDSHLGTSPKPSWFLKPISKDSVSSVGCTPPLPRKPTRGLTPVADSRKNKEADLNDSILDRSRSRSPPNEQQKRVPITPFAIKTNLRSSGAGENNASGFADETESSPNQSDLVSEETGYTKQGDKQTNIGKSWPNSNQRKPLPDRPPPPLTNQTSHQIFSRRAPPGRPKRPSLEGKRTPPPLPNAPRPVSIMRGNAVKVKPFRRSQSEGNIFGVAESDDSVYSEAYQHLRDSKYFDDSSKEAADDLGENGGYESPDKDAVKGFMEARQKSQKLLNKKEKSLTGLAKKSKKTTKQASTTYSSSSDDSEHEYVEPISPTPEKRMSKASLSPTNTVSSGGSSNYVQAIHVTGLAKTVKSDSTTKNYEFKPFSDMDSEWSEPKAIDWEYEGESDDSDASYVEPDEVDDLDELDDEDDQAFMEEPLYQVYQAVILEKERTMSLKRPKKGSITSPPTTPGAFTLRNGTLRGGKMLWSQLPDVRNTGLLENVTADQRKFQEAIFEVISSEASYLKSLNLLVDHFLKSQVFATDSIDSILEKHQVSELFSNIEEIVNVSERFLDDLRTRQRQSVLIESISDIITDHASNHFEAYVTYCSRQNKQGRALTDLRKTNWRFSEAIEKLERDSRVFGLTMQSFLVLPMQRVTRYPLLVDAIVRRCEPGHKEYYKTDAALKNVYQVVHKCNEGARNEERREEMIQIEKIISFMKMNPIKLVADDRWLLRRGPLQLLEIESKSTLSNTLRGRFKKYRVKPIYLFLFSDLLVVTKKKTETVYSVIDYAKRNMIRIQETTSNAKNAFVLVFLENFQKKTKELSVRADNETDLTRWREAFEPASPAADDERIYGSWDCPQVQALHDYQGLQSDELSLVPGDVLNVLRKLPDGWYEGERIRDGVCGWFPANHTEEIRNEHVRARNLHQRYRLLAASTAFLDTRRR